MKWEGWGRAGTTYGRREMAETDTDTTATGGDGPGLRRSLGFRDLVVYGLLFIAPMAPVGVFGTLDAKSHGAVALVYIVATVAMAFTAFSYAQMVRVVPRRARCSPTRAWGSARRPVSSPAGWRCSTTSSSPPSPICSPGSP